MINESEQLDKSIKDFIKSISSKCNYEQINSVAILTCLSSKDKSHNISQDLLNAFVTEFRKIYSGAITVIEKKFSDTSVENFHHNFFNTYNLNHHLITKDSQKYFINEYNKSDKIYDGFYIDSNFINSDLKIIMTNGAMHKHHSDIFSWGTIEELAISVSTSQYDWAKTKRKDAIKVLRTELTDLYEELSSNKMLRNLFGITDSRITRITNEHLPFLNRKITGELTFSKMGSDPN